METALLQALPLLTQSSLLSLSKSHFFKFQLTFYLVTKLHSRSLRQGFGLCLKIPLEQRDLLSLVNEASDPGPFGPLTLGPCLSLVCLGKLMHGKYSVKSSHHSDCEALLCYIVYFYFF